MRRFYGVILVMVLLFSLSLSAVAKDDILIGASLVGKDNQWWATTGKFVEQAAEALGVDIITLWANSNQEKQIKDVEDLIMRGVDVILLGPVQQEGSMVAVDQAYAAGIPVVTIARTSASEHVTAAVTANEEQFGRNQLSQIAKDFPDGANIVYLFGPVGAGYAIRQRSGFEEELAKHPNINVMEIFTSATDTSAEGMKNAEDALIRFGGQLDAIACLNDDLALGAVRAVEAAGKAGEVFVYGGSALPMGMQYIYDGKMHYTQLKSQSLIAVTSTEIAVKVARGEPVDEMVLVEPVEITKDNVTDVKDAVFGGTIDNPESWNPGE